MRLGTKVAVAVILPSGSTRRSLEGPLKTHVVQLIEKHCGPLFWFLLSAKASGHPIFGAGAGEENLGKDLQLCGDNMLLLLIHMSEPYGDSEKKNLPYLAPGADEKGHYQSLFLSLCGLEHMGSFH